LSSTLNQSSNAISTSAETTASADSLGTTSSNTASATSSVESTQAVENTGVDAGTTVYRVFGGDSPAFGHSWTDVDPSLISNYRYYAGLPDCNSGQFVIQGYLTDMTDVEFRSALSLDGNVGGLSELLIPDPSSQIEITNVNIANPNF